ncbi:hypothetical protein FQN54_009924 [Arachnomyces sp. PD_36]|nr:hypothetical protein FQN54_009924 [Arachnomyces sp. PD_36]
MAYNGGRSKGKEPVDSPINPRGYTPMKGNHQLEYLAPRTYSGNNGSQARRANGGGESSAAASPWTQSTASSRNGYPVNDRYRYPNRDTANQSSSRQHEGNEHGSVPPKFDPSEIPGLMDFPHLELRESVMNEVEEYLNSTARRAIEQRETRWPVPPADDTVPAGYRTGNSFAQRAEGWEEDNYGRNVPQSKSEGHLKSCMKQAQGDNPYASPPYVNHYETPIRGGQRSPAGRASSPVRGRTREREKPRSPVRFSDTIDEHDPLPYLHTPTRRTRSPHKKLFGENGWLGRSTSMKELPAEKYKKPGFKSFSDKIKQHLGDLAGDMKKVNINVFNSENNNSKIVTRSTFPISLDPPTQARVLSEVEVMICVTANKFLLQQYAEGRMSVESVAKIMNYWTSKNRAQVLEFQFDQATQRDLVLYNIKTFRFYGEASTNIFALNGAMYNWRAVSKEMSVRTFCHPDSAIRKLLHDTHKILEMLGAPLVTFLAFQELQVKTLAQIKEEQMKNLQPSKDHGVTKEYIPPSLIEAERAEAAARARNGY